jgi:hypothetical protein
MKNIVFMFLFSLLSSFGGGAQKSASQLVPDHASALQQFLSKHADLELLSEGDYSREVLKEMRKQFGPRFMPYYRVGDFNHDGRQDFAVVLAKRTPQKEDPNLADTHRFQHEITVVVFNGLRGGGYKAVFVKNTTAPLVCFLAVSEEKNGKLYFAVYETDTGFVISPKAQGYVADRLPSGD